MCAGIASNLERYENGIIYLRIENTEKAKPSNYKTAVEFARNWMQRNEELYQAKGFVVSFYTCGSTGFMVNNEVALHYKGLFDDLLQQLIRDEEWEHELINIFSGLFTNEWA